jgi:hypothetical protein
MWCDVDPGEVLALQSNDDEDIEQVEANGRSNERRGPAYFAKFVAEEIDKWSAPIKASGVTID